MKYSTFNIEKNASIDEGDLRNLRVLYSPIIGSFASSLYQLLIDEISLCANPKSKFNVNDFLRALNIKYDDFIEAKEKLEAVNLITYYESDFYELSLIKINKPMEIENFAKSALSRVLIKVIGAEKFKKIVYSVVKCNFVKDEYTNKTKSFTEVFDLDIASQREMDKIRADIDENISATNIIDLASNMIPNEFIKHLTNRELSPSQILLLDELSQLGFSYYAINLFINHSYEINKTKIVCAYIKKVAQSFYKRKILNPESIKRELQFSIASQNPMKMDSVAEELSDEEINRALVKFGLEDLIRNV